MLTAAASSDDELVPPAALFQRAIPTPSTSAVSSDTPDKASRRTAGAPRAAGRLELCATPVRATPQPRRSPRLAVGASTAVPADASSAPVGAPCVPQSEQTEEDERERHRRLAEELFPPSPPSHASALAPPNASVSASPATSAPVNGSSPLYRAGRPRSRSPDIISDSEVERAAAATAHTATRRKGGRAEGARMTPSVVHGLSDSDDSSDGEKGLAKRMAELGFGHTSAPHPDVFASTPSQASDQSPAVSSSRTRTERTARARRRITISIASSSSSSASSASDEEAEVLPAPARAFPVTPRPRAGQPIERTERVVIDEEILAACTDDEEVEAGVRRLPDDVRELDGVFIYDPTPKKRPVKLTPARPAAFLDEHPFAPSTPHTVRPKARSTSSSQLSRALVDSPSGLAGGVTVKAGRSGASNLRQEIDLTESSSEEELSPPPKSCLPSTPAHTKPKPARAPRLPQPPSTIPSSIPRPRARPVSATASSTLTTAQRSSLPLALIRELDRSVFRCEWSGLRRVSERGGKGLPDGIEVVWNKRLRNTAGRASWKSTRTSLPGPAGSPPVRTQTHRAVVELSTHVTDTTEKLKHTLAHELCHLAAWALSGEMKPPHGAAFKLWASRVMVVRPDIEVTTTHSYEIAYRFRWQCTSATCGKIFGRHSNSVNPATHGCPCRARIVALDRDGVAKPALPPGAVETPRKKSKWQEFMQAESPRVRVEHPGLPQSEVLKLVAERWRAAKAAATAPGAGAAGVEDGLAALSLS